jgi:AcrR family transcriptional regulator
MAYRKTDHEIQRLQRRRGHVLDAAVAVVRRGGFRAAKAREIAEEAGVSIGSLYLGFEGLDGLRAEVFGTLAERELQRVARDVEAASSPHDALVALVRGFGARSLTAPMVAWALLLEPAGPAIDGLRLRYRADYADLVASVIRGGIECSEFSDQDVEVSAPAVIGAIAESLVRPLDPQFLIDAPGSQREGVSQGLIEQIVQLCLRAVGAPANASPESDGDSRAAVSDCAKS